MNKILLFNLTAALIFINNISAQGENPISSKRQIFISEGYVGIGGYTNRGFVNAANYYEDLAPNATITLKRFEVNTDQYSSNTNGTGVILGTMGFGWRDKDSKDNVGNKRLRVGFIYSSSVNFDGTWENEERYPYDTLVSQVSPYKLPVDSVYSETINFQYNYQQLGLDVSFIIRSSAVPRFSAYGGLGVSASMSYSARTKISYSERSSLSEEEYINSSYNNPYHFFDRNYDYNRETFKNKMNHNLYVYIPLGMDFRFGCNHPFWKMIHVYYEMRPGVNFLFVPEIGNISTLSLSNIVGLRVKFNG